MEWISFNLNSDKKHEFEKNLLPMLWKSHGSLLVMSNLSWSAYSKQHPNDNHTYLFCTDSGLFMKFIKAFVGDYSRVFSVPDTSELNYFGPENLIS